MRTKDKQGLYFQGEFKAGNYSDAIKELFQLEEIPIGFCVDEDHEANGYSVVDSNGIQHIYELSNSEFYNSLMNLNESI